MKSFLGFALLALFSLGGLTSAQQISAKGIDGPFHAAPKGRGPVPVTSPEPSTLAALIGGVTIAGGIALRQRRNKNS